MSTKDFIIELCRRYPKLQPTDLGKALYQSTFGCEHLISDPSAAADYIRKEAASAIAGEVMILPLDGDFSRVDLSILQDGLSPDTFAALFALSAKQQSGDIEILEQKLSAVEAMAEHLPFSVEDWAQYVSDWKQKGYPACHHSAIYRENYHPAYRLLHNDYVWLLPLFCAIDRLCAEKEHILIAIEGSSASGKSTLSALLETVYDCNILHMDDFFLQPHQRTEARLAEIGGNVDYERFADEVMMPLMSRQEVTYRPFDCSTFTLGEAITLPKKKLNIIEGAYSMHPTLAEHYDFSVFLKIDPDTQRKRIEQRNSPFLQEKFFNIWIPMEKRYFLHSEIEKRCKLILEVK